MNQQITRFGTVKLSNDNKIGTLRLVFPALSFPLVVFLRAVPERGTGPYRENR